MTRRTIKPKTQRMGRPKKTRNERLYPVLSAVNRKTAKILEILAVERDVSKAQVMRDAIDYYLESLGFGEQAEDAAA